LDNSEKANCQTIEEDEIDLRELFATIWKRKWFIIIFTFIITAIVIIYAYRMPKYYKTTTTIEIKSNSNNQQGVSLAGKLGGLGALVGLPSGGGGAGPALDAAKITLFRTNKLVLDNVKYSTQYFITNKYRPIEIYENNSSIIVNKLYISNYKYNGIKVLYTPISDKAFKLSLPSKLKNKVIGTFQFNKPIHTKFFDCIINKKPNGDTPEYLILNGDKHYIFNNIISKNLSAEVGSGGKKSKANLPFVTISYLDTLPNRGELYIEELLQKYIKQSVSDELEDINIKLSSIEQQIKEIKTQAQESIDKYEEFKSKNAILSPETQTKILIQQKALVDNKITDIIHKLSLLKQLIASAKNKKNIDTMAPALSQLGDTITAKFIGKIQDLQTQEEALAEEFTGAYPKLKSIKKQIQDLRNKIAKSLINLQNILSDELKLLKLEQNKYISKLKKIPQIETDLAPLTRDYKLYGAIYTYLLQKRSTLKLKKAEALSRFRIIDPIYTNPKPVKPKKSLIVVVGFITAFILSIFIVFFLEFLKSGKE